MGSGQLGVHSHSHGFAIILSVVTAYNSEEYDEVNIIFHLGGNTRNESIYMWVYKNTANVCNGTLIYT